MQDNIEDLEMWDSDEELVRGSDEEVVRGNDQHFFDGSDTNDSDDREKIKDTNLHKFIAVVCTFVLIWQCIFRVPDVAVGVLFKFIGVIYYQISKITSSTAMQRICDLFPTMLSNARKMLAIDRDNLKKMFVCRKCHSTYSYEDCFTHGINACVYISFPRHPQQKMRMKCLEPLVKTVKLSSGKKQEVPVKVFCYKILLMKFSNSFLEKEP